MVSIGQTALCSQRLELYRSATFMLPTGGNEHPWEPYAWPALDLSPGDGTNAYVQSEDN
jgi:hypothetical protein